METQAFVDIRVIIVGDFLQQPIDSLFEVLEDMGFLAVFVYTVSIFMAFRYMILKALYLV